MDPTILKARNFRKVLLPSELYQKLDQIKGPTYLWESYSMELREVLRKLKRHARKVRPTFEPSALYWFVHALFRDYNKTHEHKVNSHDFRRRAISMSFDRGFSEMDVGRMFGLDSLTARNYYDAWKKRNTDKQFAEIGPVLIPTPAPMVKTSPDLTEQGVCRDG